MQLLLRLYLLLLNLILSCCSGPTALSQNCISHLQQIRNLKCDFFCQYANLSSSTESKIKAHAASFSPFSNVKIYLMFIGFARSGHSLIGSVIDAAPNAIIANEYHAWQVFRDRRTNHGKFYPSRTQLLQDLVINSDRCNRAGRCQWYNYSITGLWQGRIASGSSLDIIGDKKGSSSLEILKKFGGKNGRFGLKTFMKFIGIKFAFISVFRNPLNIIATQALRENALNKTDALNNQVSDNIINQVLSDYSVLLAEKSKYPSSTWHIVKAEDFSLNTREELEKLCVFLNLECPELWFKKVTDFTSHGVSNSWLKVKWTGVQLSKVTEFINTRLAAYYTVTTNLTVQWAKCYRKKNV